MSSLQCLKRVYLEVNRRELAKYSKATEAAFALGHQVGDIAVKVYGGESGSYIEYNGGSFAKPLALTAKLMSSIVRSPIFEATLQHDGVLVREDVLLPVEVSSGQSWDIVEVKASTKLKPEHIHDCAIQAWVHKSSGHPLRQVLLAHIDSQFVYPGEQRFDGLFAEHDVSEEVRNLMPQVPIWVERAQEAAAGPMPDIPVGAQCTSPYPCPFMDFCWPSDSRYPVRGLGGGGKKLGEWIARGYRDIRDVPAHEISSENQLRIRSVTARGRAELLPGAREFTRQLPYPRFYLDFETISPAIPIWPGTRPYQVLPFQWSSHIEAAPGKIRHEEFLDLTGEPPMRRFAVSLIDTLQADGPVLMYSIYEKKIIEGLIEMFENTDAELARRLENIVPRLVDLLPVTKQNYYHPDMLGSWSIKAVLPTIAPDMDYADLGEIQEGTEASQAYLEAISPQTSAERKEQLRAELLTYCKHDTEAMVRLVEFFQGNGAAS